MRTQIGSEARCTELPEAGESTAERDAALTLVDRMAPGRRITPGAWQELRLRGFIAVLQARGVTPHVAQLAKWASAARRGRAHDAYSGYTASGAYAKPGEEVFGWTKEIGGLRQTSFAIVSHEVV